MVRPHAASYRRFPSVPSTHWKKKGEERADIFLWKHHMEAHVLLCALGNPQMWAAGKIWNDIGTPLQFFKNHQSALHTWNHRHLCGGGSIISVSGRWKLRYWEVEWYSQQAREATFPGQPWELLYLYLFSNQGCSEDTKKNLGIGVMIFKRKVFKNHFPCLEVKFGCEN